MWKHKHWNKIEFKSIILSDRSFFFCSSKEYENIEFIKISFRIVFAPEKVLVSE